MREIEDLRPDALGETIDVSNQDKVDDRVIAPQESLDDREDNDDWFEMDEKVSVSGTGYDGTDPAIDEGGF